MLWTTLLVTFDQITKLWAQARFGSGGEERYLGLGFYLTYTRNEGAAFGILQDRSLTFGSVTLDGTLLLGLLSATVALGLTVYLLRRRHDLPRLSVAALTLILAGAAGNMIDRLRLGYVIDFIHFHVGSFDFPVFNIADSCVVIGAGLLLLHSLLPPAPAPRQPALDAWEARLLDPDPLETPPAPRSADAARDAEPPLDASGPNDAPRDPFAADTRPDPRSN